MYRHVPMRELLFILILVFAAVYWILNPAQIDTAANWAIGLFHR
jgi:hypothetical protein